MLYDWPHQIYQKLGPRMSETTPRENLITREINFLAERMQLRLKPRFVVGSVPASAGAFSGNAVIVISPAMLDPKSFSDNEVRFILAHELGHIARLDAYRFWTRWTDSSAEAREFDADRIAVGLVGCRAMQDTVARHWGEFMKGYQEDGDHHPHPRSRLIHACPGDKLKSDGTPKQSEIGPNPFTHQHSTNRSEYHQVDRPATIGHRKSAGTVRVLQPTVLKNTEESTETPLTINGLGGHNQLLDSSLVFSLRGSRSLDLVGNSNGLILGANGTRVALRPFWRFDDRTNSFTIDATSLTKLSAQLPAGSLEVSLNFVSEDGEYAAVYEFTTSRRELVGSPH